MATQAQVHTGGSGDAPSLAEVIDRWIYVFMALFLIAVILTGFVPDSFVRIAAIEAGERGPFLPQGHFHALTMGAWMLLLLAQTTLMATGRRQWHMQLGLLGMVLAPLLVLAGYMLATANIQAQVAFAENAPPQVQEAMAERLHNAVNIVLVQIRAGIGFLSLIVLALLARRRDSGMHKRLMILAITAPLGAATSRIPLLYSTAPDSPLSSMLWPLACVLPMFLWDLYRLRRIHRAYWIYAAIMLPISIAAHLLWNSAWWHAFAPPLLYG